MLTLQEAIRQIAQYPKEGEPEEPGSPYVQSWKRSDDPHVAVDALHAVIDIARQALKDNQE